MRKVRTWIEPLIFFTALALLWEFGALGFGVRRYLLPPLSEVAAAGWSLREEIIAGAWATSLEVVAGFVVAVLGGVILGVVIHFSNFARRTV